MATDQRIRRYSASARRFHAAVYLLTLVLLGTGWWLLTGREGQPSPVAQLTGIADVSLHVVVGWALAVIALVPFVFAGRRVAAFTRETLRRDPGDLRWLARWPAAVFTGRFPRHEGHFDPGQRLANVAIVSLLAVLLISGIGLVFVHVGPTFALLAAVHRLATIAFTLVIAGHIVIAAGILPGYHGAWRSMHLGGHLRLETARRLWPGWTERNLASASEKRAADVKGNAPRARTRGA